MVGGGGGWLGSLAPTSRSPPISRIPPPHQNELVSKLKATHAENRRKSETEFTELQAQLQAVQSEVPTVDVSAMEAALDALRSEHETDVASLQGEHENEVAILKMTISAMGEEANKPPPPDRTAELSAARAETGAARAELERSKAEAEAARADMERMKVEHESTLAERMETLTQELKAGGDQHVMALEQGHASRVTELEEELR